MNLQRLSPTLFATLIEQAAQGNISMGNLVSQVQNQIPVSYQEYSAMFKKEKPQEYVVTLYKDGVSLGEEQASTPIEAKLMVLDYLISMAKEYQKAKPKALELI